MDDGGEHTHRIYNKYMSDKLGPFGNSNLSRGEKVAVGWLLMEPLKSPLLKIFYWPQGNIRLLWVS